jgi:hypothetical protein
MPAGIFDRTAMLSATGVAPPLVAGQMHSSQSRRGHSTAYDISLCSGMC